MTYEIKQKNRQPSQKGDPESEAMIFELLGSGYGLVSEIMFFCILSSHVYGARASQAREVNGVARLR